MTLSLGVTSVYCSPSDSSLTSSRKPKELMNQPSQHRAGADTPDNYQKNDRRASDLNFHDNKNNTEKETSEIFSHFGNKVVNTL